MDERPLTAEDAFHLLNYGNLEAYAARAWERLEAHRAWRTDMAQEGTTITWAEALTSYPMHSCAALEDH